MTKRRLRRVCSIAAALLGLAAVPRPAAAQNDWQSPDPYFGVFQHRQAGTPEAERRYQLAELERSIRHGRDVLGLGVRT